MPVDQRLVSLLLSCEGGDELPPQSAARVDEHPTEDLEVSAAMEPLLLMAPFAEMTPPAPAPSGSSIGETLRSSVDGDAAASALKAEVLPAISSSMNSADRLRPAEVCAAAGMQIPDAALAPDLASSGSFSLNPAAPPTASAPPAAQALPSFPLDVRGEDWPRQLGERIHWQLGAGLQEARIELAPEGLGPLELRVQVDAGQVQLHIGAAHAATRELLGEALPRLRELLGDSGLSLGQASVSSQQERPPPPLPARNAVSLTEPEVAAAPMTPIPRLSRGLLDHYA